MEREYRLLILCAVAERRANAGSSGSCEPPFARTTLNPSRAAASWAVAAMLSWCDLRLPRGGGGCNGVFGASWASDPQGAGNGFAHASELARLGHHGPNLTPRVGGVASRVVKVAETNQLLRLQHGVNPSVCEAFRHQTPARADRPRLLPDILVVTLSFQRQCYVELSWAMKYRASPRDAPHTVLNLEFTRSQTSAPRKIHIGMHDTLACLALVSHNM